MSTMPAQIDQTLTVTGRPSDRLVALGTDRWRVVAGDGHVRGLVRRVQTPRGERFLALRFHAPSRSFRSIGEFWRIAEAADTLRLSR
ncbi:MULTISPECIES: hypothetical protein [Microbacterium]|jgi:hypothetical protein|uniref:hypothetical protein n=1 Tax=Microbacterium TaxID=33882 RepID=UPI000E771FF9|nr:MULTISPECIES: hypothetical protein [Microbacterium]MDF2579376.1 hypothetical protein [Microbacterium sp.]RKE63161.1 hypothetical protein DEU36_0356 [Microbacterium sp. AG238]WJM17207.1 hypothetical protein QUC20_07895 [Microbacterium arborescens]